MGNHFCSCNRHRLEKNPNCGSALQTTGKCVGERLSMCDSLKAHCANEMPMKLEMKIVLFMETKMVLIFPFIGNTNNGCIGRTFSGNEGLLKADETNSSDCEEARMLISVYAVRTKTKRPPLFCYSWLLLMQNSGISIASPA